MRGKDEGYNSLPPTSTDGQGLTAGVPSNRVLIQRGDYNTDYLAELADRLTGLADREGACLGYVNFNGEVRQYARLIRQAANFLMSVVEADRFLAAEEGVATTPTADGEVRDARSAPNDRTQKETPSNHTEESKP